MVDWAGDVPRRANAECATQNLSVLLLEEPGWLRSALELALSLRGDALTATDDPAAALERLRTERVDLVLVGLFPSGVENPAQLCRALREAAPGRLASVTPPIVACVPASDPARVAAAIDAGASSFLYVPVDVQQVRARLALAERLKDDLATLAAEPASEPPAQDDDHVVAEEPLATPGNGARVRPGDLVERALDPLLVTSPEGVITYASPAAETLFGRSPVELAGLSLYTLMHPDDTSRALELVAAALADPEQPLAADLRVIHRDGSARDVDVRAGNLLEEPGVGGLVLALRDITERKRLEEQLERQALYDSLTRLPNRTLFMDYLEHGLARADRRLESVVVMFFDLDNFKLVNDTYGHPAGDILLARVGERLRGCLRASDTAARWGGDEFTVLLEDVATEEDAIVVAERVRSELSAPFSIDDHELYVSASIGIAFSTPGESRPNELLRDADTALYRAKAEGKNRYVIFDDAPALPARRDAAARRAEPPEPEAPEPEAPPAIEPAPQPAQDDDTLRTLMARISALEREAGRLEAELDEERRRG